MNLQMHVEAEFRSADCLRDYVTLVEDGVTLGDIISFVAKDEFLSIFISAYSGCCVSDFYEELQHGTKPPEGEAKYCTVMMEIEVSETQEAGVEKNLGLVLEFYGRSDDGKKWSLDLASLAEIAELPFRLESNASITYIKESGIETDEGLGYAPKLLEVLDAIFFDLSFHGSAADKANVALDLQQAIQAIENGTAEVEPWLPKKAVQ